MVQSRVEPQPEIEVIRLQLLASMLAAILAKKIPNLFLQFMAATDKNG